MSRATVRTPTIEFARRGSASESAGDVVRRKGVIFRAGDYPIQGYVATIDKLRGMADGFVPVPIDHGHPTAGGPLDGAFGELESVELSADGTTLYGVAAFPRWLEKKLGDARRLVSATIDRATDRIKSLSLVTRPQIDDAELVAAFCACQAETTPITKEETTMTKKEQLRKHLDGLGDGDDVDEEAVSLILFPDTGSDETETDATDEQTPAGFSAAEFAELEARFEAAEKRLAAAHQATAKKDAVSWAEHEVLAGRSSAAEFGTRVEEYMDAVADDDYTPRVVTFSHGGQKKTGSRVDALKARHAARPARFFGERLPVNDDEMTTFSVGDKGESDRDYAKRVCAKYNGKNRIAGTAS